jgi:PTS system cellobiose-specific IIB component
MKMSYRVILACSSGVSSTIIAGKMKAAVKVSGLDVLIDVVDNEKTILDKLVDVDILLLAPQMGHLLESLQQKYPEITIKIISERDFSVMDGDAILEKAFIDEHEIVESVEQKEIFIVIACVEGFSSALLTKKMKLAAAEINPAIDIKATAAIASLIKRLDQVDILLLGPNVAFMKSDFQKLVPKDTIISGIDMLDYGMINGKAIVEKALKILNK